ncbi:MAG: hypothetical protein GXO94_04980 [Nitrospirae bacterium]|nr:hypothetical protein [Nitrospirota bacterium]
MNRPLDGTRSERVLSAVMPFSSRGRKVRAREDIVARESAPASSAEEAGKRHERPFRRQPTVSAWILALPLLVILAVAAPSYVFSQDDMLQYLQSKGAELDKKEQMLEEREKELQDLEEDITARIKEYEAILGRVEDILAKIEKNKEEKIQHVVKTYEKMQPEEAAVRIEKLDQRTAVKVLAFMKPRKAANILSMMSPRKAARLTEKITEIPGLEKLIARMKKKR